MGKRDLFVMTSLMIKMPQSFAAWWDFIGKSYTCTMLKYKNKCHGKHEQI
jgi:hypothetical protein